MNVADPETGNTPLHLASRHGHFVCSFTALGSILFFFSNFFFFLQKIALHLLENGSDVNACNNGGCTPFFVAVEGLHGNIGKVHLSFIFITCSNS